MLSNPIFIIGTERSGSNLLRLLLNAHSKICIPHPPHLLRDFAPFAKQYGDLKDDANLQALVRDITKVVNMHFAPWPFSADEKTVLKELESRSLYGVYATLYEMYCRHFKKPRWGCKSTFMYQQIATILEHHQSPRFLHLVRDPRDVAVSAKNSIFSRYHPFKQAQLWTEQQTEIERWSGLKQEGKLLQIRYEDLTQNPEQELKKIMLFLGESFESSQLTFFRDKEARSLSSLSESWKNCAAPVSNSNVGRFQKMLAPGEIAAVEFHARPLMQKYGYLPLTKTVDFQPTITKLLAIEGLERWKMLQTEAYAFFTDKNFSLRWRKRFYLQYLQKTRSMSHG